MKNKILILIKKITSLLVLIFIFSCNTNKKQTTILNDEQLHDSHVHLMSPTLINYWKSLGIPFSKSEVNYSNIDTILKNNKANSIDLISMAYVYGNPEYYQGNDSREKMIEENNYLFKVAKKYPKRITPYFAIDPLRKYAIEEMERCYKINPKSGLKLHFNTSQVYLTVPEQLEKIKAVFQQAASYNLPILLHFDNWHPKFGERDVRILANAILKDLPPIELKIAHFGTSGGFKEKTKRFIDAYIQVNKEGKIPSKHTILFDISAVALDKDSQGVSKLTIEEFQELKRYIDKIGIKNITFGTDYPLYTSHEYYNILKEKVGLSKEELIEITQKNNE